MTALDLCAELTLQVLRFVQQPADPPCSPLHWLFIPEGRRTGWLEARQLLADAPKPLMVAALSEPGMIGSWGIRALRDHDLARAEHSLINQQQWLEEAATRYRWAAGDKILFETAADSLELPLDELRRWLREYAIFAGWTVGEGPDAARPGRLFIRKPNGGWSPGMICKPEPAG